MLHTFLLAAVLAGQASAPQAARVTGQVLEAGTGVPIGDARLTLSRAMSGPPQPGVPFSPPLFAITSDDGRYAFEGLEAGNYRVSVQKAGFFVASPNMNGYVVRVSAGESLEIAAIALQRGGAINGRVLGPSGQPLAEARVFALPVPSDMRSGRVPPMGGSWTAQTNDLGEYRVFGLAPGEYQVQASPRIDFGPPGAATPQRATMLVPTYAPSATERANAQVVLVAAGETTAEVVVQMVMARAFQISGVVTDEAGAPVSGAMVTTMPDPVSRTPATGPPPRAQTNTSGEFVLTNLPSGMYRISVSIPEQLSVPPTSGAGVGTGVGGVSITGGMVGGVSGGVTGGFTTVTSSGGVTTRYTYDPLTEVRVTLGDQNVEGLTIVTRRAPARR